ncbi:UNVERIFIED_CONTAM: hypothetical protein FKN15_024551 [Acipenser sinensis]
MWDKAAVFLLKLSWTFCLVSAIARRDLFPYGPHSGDSALPEGDDETSEVLTLKRPLYFYETKFSELYVGTNGIISPQDFPQETQYVDDGFPTDFPVIAPFLADLDTSNGKGAIYYREDDSTEVLIRAAEEVKRGFPESTFSPTAAFIATWDSVGPYEELTRNSVPSNRASYPEPSYPEPSYPDPSYPQASYPEPSYPEPSYPEPSYPDPSYPQASYPEPSYPEPSYPDPSYPQASYPEPSYPEPSNPQPREADVQAVYPEGGVIPLPESSPPHTQGRSVVSVDEDVDVDAGVFVYNTESRETCAQFEGRCSRHAYCSDYSWGFCCHCQSGYYGNGRHCLPDGVPHRVNGKVSGRVLVGATPVDLGSVDLHAYVVVSDGRAYTAVSHVPEPAGWALMPLSPIGGLFGWLFALELTGHENGFSITEDPEPVVVSPCYEGTHECDMTAQCIPGEGTQYQCRCATGYRGDGRNCYDMDECAEGLSSCGSHSLCVNLQGSHHCECQSGYHFTVDGRTCIDIDECASPRCDPHATCFNTPGSFHCRCVPGYKGDGFLCLASPGKAAQHGAHAVLYH